jgi:replicative DNA helicase
MNIEQIILQNLVKNDVYARKVIPFLKPEYFHDRNEQIVYSSINEFIIQYNSMPSKEALWLSIEKKKNITQDEYSKTNQIVNHLFESNQENTLEWLLDETENFCKEKAVYNAIMNSINIIDGKDSTPTTSIPDILSKALAVSFDSHIGHDYTEDYLHRYEFYHTVEHRIPFDLNTFNEITGGGVPSKTLSVVMAGTGVGKSLYLCHHAAACLKQHKNVLYITCEMSEEKIAERIDANILDVTMDDLKELPLSTYEKKVKNACGDLKNKLIIKEYPTATANANHFRFLLDELWMKKKFKPDIIFVDYLNICASSRMKQNANTSSYNYVKAIAEELRGLAVEYNVPLFTATQTNRTGFSSTDLDMDDTSESFGLPMTADFMFALISTEELEQSNHIMVKQLKNRYNNKNFNTKFMVGINRAKMKLTNATASSSLMPDSTKIKKKQSEDFFGKKRAASVSDWNM